MTYAAVVSLRGSMQISPATTLHRYRFGEPLGAGGRGEVYRAHDTKLGRELAIKVLPVADAQDPERLADMCRSCASC